MSEDRKNELLAAYVNRNKEKIAGLLSDMALGKGIELKISSVGAKSIPEA
jgi:hypothetical protein